MFLYSIKRTLLMIPILLGITLLSFGIMHLRRAGRPRHRWSSRPRRPPKRGTAPEALRRGPAVHKQYLTWLTKFVTLDFGEAFADGPQGEGQDP